MTDKFIQLMPDILIKGCGDMFFPCSLCNRSRPCNPRLGYAQFNYAKWKGLIK